MTEKEIKIQLALGTLSELAIVRAIRLTTDPELLKALAQYAYQIFSDFPQREGDPLADAFRNNLYTPELVKLYIEAALRYVQIEQHYNMVGLWDAPKKLVKIKEELFGK